MTSKFTRDSRGENGEDLSEGHGAVGMGDSFANLYGSVARLVFLLALTAFGLLGSAVETVTGIEVMGKVVGVGEEETVEAADTTE